MKARVRMTWDQKADRRDARRNGQRVITWISHALSHQWNADQWRAVREPGEGERESERVWRTKADYAEREAVAAAVEAFRAARRSAEAAR